MSRSAVYARYLLRCSVALIAAGASLAGVPLEAQSTGKALKLDTGKEIYMAGCVSCHGPDGKGQAEALAGFERPATFPDFTDCPTSTPEPDAQWRAIVSNGGAARAFSQIMPSFKDLLTAEQIRKVVEHLRTLCVDKAWPRGNLNFPRALVTEKAFPENEAVVTTTFNAHGVPGASVSAIYERRLGASAMIEASVPYVFSQDSGKVRSGFGDVTLGFKRTIVSSWKTGSIFSAGAEVALPTGNASLGTGSGSAVFETFVAFGQALPRDSFIQIHSGVELPIHPDRTPRAYYLRTAVGKTFSSGQGFGRRWSPMMEVIADRELEPGAKTNWDVMPEVQIPLSKRLHILGGLGLRIPVTHTTERPKQVMFYVLWDYVDGPLTEGWR